MGYKSCKKKATKQIPSQPSLTGKGGSNHDISLSFKRGINGVFSGLLFFNFKGEHKGDQFLYFRGYLTGSEGKGGVLIQKKPINSENFVSL
jgi:hypothetical protein